MHRRPLSMATAMLLVLLGCGTVVLGSAQQADASVGDDVALTLAIANPARLVVGYPSTYSFTVTNSGSDPATSATVSDQLPADVGYTSAFGASCAVVAGTVDSGQRLLCTVTPSSPIADGGGTASFTVDVTPVATHVAVVNQAAVDASGASTPFDAANCVANGAPDAGCAVTTGLAMQADVLSPPALPVTTALNTSIASIDVRTATTSSQSEPINDPTIDGQAVHGTASVNSDGTLSYVPDADFSGADAFSYQVCDTGTPANCASATITVAVLNDFTDGAAAAGISTPQNAAVTVTLAQLVSVDGAALEPTSVTQVTAPLHGALTIDSSSGAVTYTPTQGYSGADSYVVQVCDTSSPAQCHDVTVPVAVGVDVVTAANQTATTTAVTPTDPIAVKATATSISQPLANPTIPVPPAHGTATITSDGSVIYTPAAHFSGTEVFGYRICDTSSPDPVCVTKTITVLVTNTFSDGAAASGIITEQNAALTSSLDQFVTTVGEPIAPHYVVVSHSPDHGAVSVDGSTGAVTYTPHAGYSGADSFTLHLCDASAPVRQCHDVTVPVIVRPDVVAVPDEQRTIAVDSNTGPIDVLVASRSASGQRLARPVISVAPAHGRATINPNGTITYAPDSGFRGVDRFHYTVCDTGNPPVCDGATVVVTVTAVADLAVADVLPQQAMVAGEQQNWTLRVINHGPASATNVHSLDLVPAVISDPTGTPDHRVPDASCSTRRTTSADLLLFSSAHAGLTIAGYPKIVQCSYPRLASGAIVQSRISGVLQRDVAPGQRIVNEATARSDTFDPNLANNGDSTVSRTKAFADLVLTTTADRSSVAVGDHDTVILTLHNNGPSDAADIDVDDTSTAMSYVSSSPSAGTFNPARGRWHLNTLDVGATVTLTITGTVIADAAANVARISHSNAIDPVSSNNGGAQCVSGESGCGSVQVGVAANSLTTQRILATTGVDSLRLLAIALLFVAGGVLVNVAARRDSPLAGR